MHLLEWAAVHWLQFAQQAETTDECWRLPPALPWPCSTHGLRWGNNTEARLCDSWQWWAHVVSLLSPHPSFIAVRKKNKLHTDPNRPQGTSKVDPKDVLLYVSANSDSGSIHTACLMFHLHLWLRKLSKRSSIFQSTDPRNPRQSHACVVSQHLKLNTTVISIHNIYSFYQKS